MKIVKSTTFQKLSIPEGASRPIDRASSKSETDDSTQDFERLVEHLSDEGSGQKGFENAVRILSEHSINNSSPGFLGKLVSAPSPPGVAADLFISLLNNNGHVWRASPALTSIEKGISVELARMFGLDGIHAGGITVPGGAAGNMLALTVARNIISPDSKRHGVVPGKYAIFVSDAAHYSVSNAAQIVGLGQDSVFKIPTLADETMDVNLLETAVNSAVEQGRVPLFINATAGNTVNGAFDTLDRIGKIARKANAWFHVDACWGGAVAFSENLRHLLKGSEQADSIAFNPHKMLGVPLVCAFLLTRDVRHLWLANKLDAGYLFHDRNAQNDASSVTAQDKSDASSDSDGIDWRNSKLLDGAPSFDKIRDLASLTVQCSRRSDATKMFLHWIYYGRSVIGNEVERTADVAQYLARLVQRHLQFDLIGDVEKVFAQVCFYWRPKAKAHTQTTSVRNPDINSRNTHVLYERMTDEGWRIDYAPYKSHGDCIRIACNRLTTKDEVEAFIIRLKDQGESLGL